MKHSFHIVALLFGLCIWLSPPAALAQEMGFLGLDKGNPFVFSSDFSEAGWIDEQKAGMSIPFYTGKESSVFGLVRAHRIGIQEQIVLMDRGYEVPTEFGWAEVGVGWGQVDARENKVGASVMLGSSGRQVLHEKNYRTINATAFVERKLDNGNAWIYMVAYSNNRTFLRHVPLPGFAYVINGESHKLILGLPFVFGLWRQEKFMLNGVALPFYLSTEISYFFYPPFQVFTNAAWAPKAIDNPGTPDEAERLFYDKKEWSLGLRMFLSRQTNLSAAYLYSFDRKFYLGRSLFEKTSDVAHVADASGFVLKLKIGF